MYPTWNPTYQKYPDIERYIASVLCEETAIDISDGLFKGEWGTVALTMEGKHYANHTH